jgi:ABC-type transporter Mla subunit MlaD
MHNHIAALEKFQLAATHLETARHNSSPDMKQLAELSDSVAASGDALAEVA